MGNAQVGPTRNLADAARSERTFKIDGFSSTSTASSTATGGHDECIVVCSRWSVGWHEWEIRCYPASSVCNMWVSLKLVLLARPAGAGDVVTARLDCWLMDPAGLAEQSDSEARTVSAAFPRHYGGESAPLVLAHRRDLEVSGYLRGDGTLTVKCAITVLREERPGADMPRRFLCRPQTWTGTSGSSCGAGRDPTSRSLSPAKRSPRTRSCSPRGHRCSWPSSSGTRATRSARGAWRSAAWRRRSSRPCCTSSTPTRHRSWTDTTMRSRWR